MERYRTTIIMAVSLIVLAAVALFLNNKNASSPGTATPVPVTYVWEDTNPVTAIDIVSGTSKVSLKKDPTLGSWAITAPINKPADVFAVSGVADSLQKLQAQFTLSATTDLAQYGLSSNPMAVTTTFSDTKGTTRTLNVGAVTPDGVGYYVKTADSPNVYVVSNTTLEPLRSWLTTPPVQQPTATPIPITVVPETPTSTPTNTPEPGAGSSSTTVVSGTVGTGSTPVAPTPSPGKSPPPVAVTATVTTTP